MKVIFLDIVRTDSKAGLTPSMADMAIKILSKDEPL